MIKQFLKWSLLSFTVVVAMHTSAALVPKESPAGHQDYIFIENNLDSEYFIASYALNPRFSGSNKWNKYRGKQRSLGYMGNGLLLRGDYVDYWLSKGEINTPYLGSRCLITEKGCNETSNIPAELINSTGAYKVPVGSGVNGGGAARVTLAPNAYEHFKKRAIGTTEDIGLNVCSTKENYSPASGRYCRDMSTGNWDILNFNLTKKGHVELLDTKAFQEIWYGTDGTPYLTPNSRFCQYGTVPTGTAAQKTGIMCKMLKYHIQGDVTQFDKDFILYMVTDAASLGFTPARLDLQIEGGNGAWTRYDKYTGASNQIRNMMTSGDNYISVFFSNAFFKGLAESKVNVRDIDGLFTFAIDNDQLPQSGYYQFSVATKIELIPREYSVSIKPKGLAEGITPVKTGKIGDPNPIEFEYIVRQSAPKEADTIEAYVVAKNAEKRNQPYCVFSSDDKTTNVLIPAWLSMTEKNGQTVSAYSGCDATKKLNMKNARWAPEPWVSGYGYFYTTDLKLTFPMDQEISRFSMEGIDWLGKVRAEGEIKVDAKWIGVNFP